MFLIIFFQYNFFFNHKLFSLIINTCEVLDLSQLGFFGLRWSGGAYLADHGHAGLHPPGAEVRIEHLHRGQLSGFVFPSQDVDQAVKLHHAEVLTRLRR